MQEVLIKTFKKSDYQYAQALLNNGELFFQHVDAYRNMEGDCQRNDFEEGGVVENISAYIDPNVNSFYIGQPNGKQFFVDWAAVRKNYPQLQNTSNSEPLRFRISYVVDWLIYCMTYISLSTLNRSEVYETIAKLGEYSVVISDCNSFIEKIGQKVQIVKKGLVTYTDGKIINPFMKRKAGYSGQNEYRFAILANGAKTKTIQIGQVSGFICESKNIEYYLK